MQTIQTKTAAVDLVHLATARRCPSGNASAYLEPDCADCDLQ
jgi:hypothetical protein